MELLHISIVGTIFLLSLLFAARVYWADKKNITNIAFAVFALVTAVWVVFDFSLYQNSLAAYQTLLNRLNLTVVCLLVLALSFFVTVFPRELFKVPKAIYALIVGISLILIITILCSGQVVEHAFMETYGSNFEQGNSFWLFAVFVTVFALYPAIILILKFIKFQGEEKTQIKYIFYGIGLLTVFNLAFNLFIPMITKSFAYGRFGTYSSILLVGFTAYAILKAHLFNLKVILTETAVVIINVVSVVQIFTSRSVTEGLLRTVFAIFIFYGSYILVQSVKREIEQKERIEEISEEITQVNLKLKQVDAMKTEFISMASHELLTPISAIEGYLSMMLDEKMVKIDDPKARRYMDSVYQSSRRLARLVAALLNVSRLEQGRLLVQKAPVDLNEIIKQVMMELQIKAKENKQVLAYQPGEGVDAKSYGDADKIKEVIVNMAGNALKYTKEGGEITISTAIWPTEKVAAGWEHLSEHVKNDNRPTDGALQGIVHEKYRELVGDKQLVVTVKDNGVGISPANLGQLFQKFSRIGDWSTQRVSGTGLGLYISRALVEIHHGRVWADSEGEGKGSTFYFSLPLATHSEEIKTLDKQVPQAADAKPLARPAKMEAKQLSGEKTVAS